MISGEHSFSTTCDDVDRTRILRPAANYIDAMHELSRCFSPFFHSRRTSARRKMHRKENYISLFLFLKEKFHIQVFLM